MFAGSSSCRSTIYDHLQLKARVNRLLSGEESAQDPPSQTLEKRIDLLEVHRHFDSLSFLL